MARPKKDEHNYHKKKQSTQSDMDKLLGDIVDAMPPVHTRASLTKVKKEAAKLTRQRLKDAELQEKILQAKQQMVSGSMARGISTYYDPAMFGQTPGTIQFQQYTLPKGRPMRPSTTRPKASFQYQVGDIVTLDDYSGPCKIVAAEMGNYEPIYTCEIGGIPPQNINQSDVGRLIERPEPPKPVKPKAKVSFDSVIIDDSKRDQILEALEQVHQADLIFDDWGFSETIEKGKGVSMLFYGPPGTGKTLMAQAIANKLDKKLRVISTADVESSAPGEAERNIRKHFKEAVDDNAVLLFDECDSLIYNRAAVGAIMGAQINELLSQIERFDGVTLFTTNRLGTLDEAVNRRLALKLEFAMPNQQERAKIWQRMMPKKAPIDTSVDWMKLASIEITGGYIKNAVLRAARMAAAEKLPNKKKKITMDHLVRALKLEAASMLEFEEESSKHRGTYGQVHRVQGQNMITRGGM